MSATSRVKGNSISKTANLGVCLYSVFNEQRERRGDYVQPIE
jgi:hypothetical protein